MKKHEFRIGTLDEIVLTYTSNIKRLARKLFKLRLSDTLLEDFVQQGYIGLIEAYKKYDPKKSQGHFWSYARKFVKGRMLDSATHYFNHIRPSKQVNRLMIQIKKLDLMNNSPDHIANILGCSLSKVTEALNLLYIRRTISLFEPTNRTDDLSYNLLIDVIATDYNRDSIFISDIFDGSSILEKKVIKFLIDGYSRENIMEYCKISARELKKSIDSILEKCGYDHKTINNRNEVRLLKIAYMEDQQSVLQIDTESNLEWVSIKLIAPSPKNPRMDSSVNTEQMQEIITTKGWEEPISCYKKGEYYIILSGHRRWHAAKQLGEKVIPVFIVPTPKDQAEELDRLGSVQSGQVEWTPYESAKNTYDRWLYSGGMSYDDLGKKLGISSGKVGAKIRVYKYYPKVEIADKLANGMYSITMLDYIYTWIKRLVQYHPSFVASIGEDFIASSLLLIEIPVNTGNQETSRRGVFSYVCSNFQRRRTGRAPSHSGTMVY